MHTGAGTPLHPQPTTQEAGPQPLCQGQWSGSEMDRPGAEEVKCRVKALHLRVEVRALTLVR